MKENQRTARYPVGIQTFSEIREEGYVYVDKTAYVHKMVRDGKYYFLSRPRRFGKSLLLSTIEAYFSGRRDLFRGLAIDSLTDNWETYPVLHLDLNTDRYADRRSLDNMLNLRLMEWENEYHIDPPEGATLSYRFGLVITKAAETAGKPVVILVDEYDKPMLNAVG
ncbi:MAG: AAA family ATPase, partial [Clostridium sp.]|nr:AAA family ATPase [Clostridium sp.]